MKKIVEALGGPAAVSRMLKIKSPSVIGWGDRIPAERCADLERASNSKFAVETMRPDVRWVRVPDQTWPNPLGRPCIDIATADACPALSSR
jgi:DNA-binding transcriptional regulator YdaS (Cro superfamily)